MRNYYIRFLNKKNKELKFRFVYLDFLEFTEPKQYADLLEKIKKKSKELHFDFFRTFIKTGAVFVPLDFFSNF